MKTLLIMIALAACTVSGPPTSLETSASTTCVSDPIVAGSIAAGGDGSGDIVQRCPPPNPMIAAAAAASYADQNYPSVSRADGGCSCDTSYCVCVLVLLFGAGQAIDITCTSDQQGHVQCETSVDDGLTGGAS